MSHVLLSLSLFISLYPERSCLSCVYIVEYQKLPKTPYVQISSSTKSKVVKGFSQSAIVGSLAKDLGCLSCNNERLRFISTDIYLWGYTAACYQSLTASYYAYQCYLLLIPHWIVQDSHKMAMQNKISIRCALSPLCMPVQEIYM